MSTSSVVRICILNLASGLGPFTLPAKSQMTGLQVLGDYEKPVDVNSETVLTNTENERSMQ